MSISKKKVLIIEIYNSGFLYIFRIFILSYYIYIYSNMQKTFRKKSSSSSKTRKNNSRIKKMKKVVGSASSSDARETASQGLWQFTYAFLLFIVAIGIMGNIDKEINVPDNALTYNNGIRVSTEFAPMLINNAPNLKLLEIENNTTELLLENTPENINNFKDSLESIAKKYITDNKELEIVNKQLAEYENINDDNFFMSGKQAFGGKKSKMM